MTTGFYAQLSELRARVAELETLFEVAPSWRSRTEQSKDRFRAGKRLWNRKDESLLRKLYPHESTQSVAVKLGRTVPSVYNRAKKLGLAKTDEYMASPAACRLRRGDDVGAPFRFAKGHVPANKGLVDGYLYRKIADTRYVPVNGPVPTRHALAFKNGTASPTSGPVRSQDGGVKKGHSLNRMPLGSTRLVSQRRTCSTTQFRVHGRQDRHPSRQPRMHHPPRADGAEHSAQPAKGSGECDPAPRRGESANQQKEQSIMSTKNRIEDLRDHLFATLEALQDKDEPMDLARANEIANVARVIVDSAKVEVSFLNVTGERRSTNFLPIEEDEKTSPRRLGAVRS